VVGGKAALMLLAVGLGLNFGRSARPLLGRRWRAKSLQLRYCTEKSFGRPAQEYFADGMRKH